MSKKHTDGLISFELTLADALRFPTRRRPIFPPYCVKCGKPATDYTIHGHKLMRPVHVEQGPHAIKTTYEVVGVSLKAPWCATHKAEYEKQKGVQDISIWVALILFFASAFVIGRIDLDLGRLSSFVGLAEFEWLANPVLLLIVGSVVVMVAIAVLRSFVLSLLSKRKGIASRAAFSVYGSRDWVTLYFDNPHYANMFAKANSWLPK